MVASDQAGVINLFVEGGGAIQASTQLDPGRVFMLNRFVLARISRLDESMRRLAQGAAPTRLAVDAHEEMGLLEEGFHQMAATLRENTAQLEKRVASRTRELAEQNRKLSIALTEIRTLSGPLDAVRTRW